MLRVKLPGKVSFPTSSVYQDQQNGTDGYWTQQEAQVTPTCRVSPSDVEDVAVAVAELASKNCLFAVRGGGMLPFNCFPCIRTDNGEGHMGWAGAANIQNGVTVDLSDINEVQVSSDQRTTSVGGGARWEDVYLKLDALGLAVSGGRVYDVGVGGLTTGGGNSFFAPRFGFVTDNVKNFQVRETTLPFRLPRSLNYIGCSREREHCQCELSRKSEALQGTQRRLKQFRYRYSL